MTPEALAALHASCFDAAPRPWHADEFASLIAEPSTLLVTEGNGFAVGRVAGPEAELLTLAVAPEHRRQGIARRLVGRLEVAAAGRGAEEVFLEVAATNAAALGLYRGLGYGQAGRRVAYYGSGIDGLVLRKSLDRPATEHGKTI